MSIENTHTQQTAPTAERKRWLGLFVVDIPNDELFWRDPPKRARIASAISEATLAGDVVAHHNIYDEDVTYALTVPVTQENQADKHTAILQLVSSFVCGVEAAGIPIDELRVKGASLVSCAANFTMPEDPLDVRELASPLAVNTITDDVYTFLQEQKAFRDPTFSVADFL